MNPATAIRRTRDLASWVRTATPVDDPLPALVRELGPVLGEHHTFAYSLELVDGRLRLAFLHGPPAALPTYRRTLSEMLAHEGSFAYEPLAPSPAQRNRVLTFDGLYRDRPPGELQAFRALARRSGLPDRDQLRVLLCDGPSLLAWVGAVSDRAFSQEQERVLRIVAGPLRDRLAAERRLGDAPVAWAAMEAVLETTGAAAVVVRAPARVVHCNSVAAAALASDRAVFLGGLREALAGRAHGRWLLTRLPVGGPAHWLALGAPASEDPAPRTDRWRALLHLTPRQTQVLGLLARGDANKTIAAALRCSESAVEQQVAALFQRFEVGSRAALVARFWSARS
jgi:DNA-binding CsgD family transcriptional regulator